MASGIARSYPTAIPLGKCFPISSRILCDGEKIEKKFLIPSNIELHTFLIAFITLLIPPKIPFTSPLIISDPSDSQLVFLKALTALFIMVFIASSTLIPAPAIPFPSMAIKFLPISSIFK